MSDCDDNRSSQEEDDSNMEIVDTINSVAAHIDVVIATKFNTNTTNNQEHISLSEEGTSSNMSTQSVLSTTPPSQKPQGVKGKNRSRSRSRSRGRNYNDRDGRGSIRKRRDNDTGNYRRRDNDKKRCYNRRDMLEQGV